MIKPYISVSLKIMICFLTSFITSQSSTSQTGTTGPVSIKVDLAIEKGPLKPMWAFFGHDEPNYTYMKDGKKLLTELSKLSKVPVYMRIHNLLNTGDGSPSLKWGSTNVYTEDSNGKPIYDWTIIDRIFDTYVERGMKPLVEVGFMPQALSTNPDPYRRPGMQGDPEEVRKLRGGYGHAYPPKDYEKFAGLVYEWVKHSIERYGKEEVDSWLWEIWNEPDISFWRGTTEEYFKLYDYSVDAIRRALPTAKVGGPHSTGPAGKSGDVFLNAFLDHITNGTSFATGKSGIPIDFIAFHAKGQPQVIDGVVRMNMGKQLRDINRGFEIISAFPAVKHLPVIIGECDPEGCAACSELYYPNNAYRNGTMYSSYTAASFARIYDLAEAWNINLMGALTWAFEFEDQPWFAGFRDLATNGVDKPVLNVFRMFGMMGGTRVGVSAGTDYNYIIIRDSSVRGKEPDINALASKEGNTATVLIWNYHDVNLITDPSDVEIKISGISATQVKTEHYRIDQEYSNSFEAWKNMGSPQKPSPAQYTKLEEAGGLHQFEDPVMMKVNNNAVNVSFKLPRQGVSLLKLSW